MVMFEKMLTEGILWLAYGIAILSGLKFVLYTINGYRSESSVGPRPLAPSSLLRRTYRNSLPEAPPPRRISPMVTAPSKPTFFPSLPTM